MKRSRKPGIEVSSVLRLLAKGDPEEVTAAALLLGRLQPDDPRVVPALGRRLESAPSHLKPYLLQALARFDDRKSLQFVVPYLLVHGSLREQAVQLLAAKGPAIVKELRRLRRGAAPEDANTLLRVASRVSGNEAIDLMADALEGADFERAKHVMGALRERHSDASRDERRHVVDRMLAFLEAAEENPNTTAEIAALKTLAIYADGRAFECVLARSRTGQPAVIRQNALEALATMPLTKARARKLARALLPWLESGESPSIAATTLRVLRTIDPSLVPMESWVRLARSEHVDVARVALSEMKRFPKSEVLSTLLGALKRPEAALQSVAAGALGEIPDVLDDLILAHDDPEFARQQDMLRGILGSRGESVPAPQFKRLVAALLDSDPAPDLLAGRLQVLATIERPALNRTIEARARVALKQGEPARVRMLLEPLVRGRFATPLGRYLLAVAHLLLSEANPTMEHPDFERAMQLIGPLARLTEWRLEDHLLEEPLLGAELRRAMAAYLVARPEPERTLGTGLINTRER